MRIFTSLLAAAAIIGSASAQSTKIDSIETGASYANDVYYSLENGSVAVVPNNNWQLGFSIGNANVAVRANTGVSSTGNGKTVIYEMPGINSDWSGFDSTGYKTWTVRNNSDSSWEEGALNHSDGSNQFDYGWGEYNMQTHVITGHRLYLAVVTSGANTLYKKVWIRNKTLGTWNISFANIDGTDSVGLSIASSAYNTKNFVYVSLVTGQIVDREPAKASWDFVYTRYLPNKAGFPTVTGILTNAGVKTSEVRGVEETTSTLADTVPFSDNISTIGSDWKSYDFNNSVYVLPDSLTYFIKTNNGDFWKVVFTGFVADLANQSAPGRAIFNKTKVLSTGLNNTSSISGFAVYPNPASDVVNVLFDVTEANSTVSVMDLSGRTLHTENVSGTGFIQSNINVSSYAKGIYFISITNGSSRSVQKVVVQ